MRPHPRSRTGTLLPLALPIVLLAALALGACSNDGRDMRPPRPDQFPATTVREAVTTTSVVLDVLPGEGPGTDGPTEDEGSPSGFALSGAWPRGGPIDVRHTCDGEDRSPGLRWFGVPAGAAVLALVVTDLDADGFVHWAVANIEPGQVVLVEGETPSGAVEARNDFGVVGWSGPCPPEGDTHTYRFELHALDQQIEIAAGAPAAELLAAVEQTSIEVARYEGTYGKS